MFQMESSYFSGQPGEHVEEISLSRTVLGDQAIPSYLHTKYSTPVAPEHGTKQSSLPELKPKRDGC